jgi:putative ABC transport system substrate-binding protein
MRSAEGKFERFGEILAELISQPIDVIVTVGDEMTREAKRVAGAVPIVMATSIDPVGVGVVTSLARPGGNITGFIAVAGSEIDAKRLALLKELVPKASRVAFLGTPTDWEGPDGKAIRAAARAMGITLLHVEQTPRRYGDAFELIVRNRPDALFVARNPASYGDRGAIVDFAVEHRLPGAFPNREFVEVGGLMSYGVSIPDLFRRAAGSVDRILKRAKPADLPVEQPTKFDLVINLKAAKALAISVPATLLVLADEVIE